MSEMSDYLRTFMDETDEQLDELVEVLLVLEREPDSVEELNEAFRLIHSIKGAAGMMGFDNITGLTHHLESRFETLRGGLTRLDEQTMNLVLRCIDFLRECLERLRNGKELGSAGELLEEVMALGEQTDQALLPPTPAPEPARTSEPAPPDETDAADAASGEEAPDAGEGYRLTVHFEPGLPLADLKARLILARLGELGEIATTRPDRAALETAQALSELQVVLTSEESADTIRAAVNLDGVESVDLAGGSSAGEPASAPAALAPAPSEPAAEPEPVAEPEPASVERAAEPMLGGDGGRPKGTETMRVDIDRLDSLLNLAGELVVNRARFVQLEREVRPAFQKRNVVGRARDFGESMRSMVERLEGIADDNGDLEHDIEELKAGLDIIEEQSELWDHGRRGFAQISEAIDQLVRISDSLQQSVLDTRMVPVGPLFSRFKRVVRDLSKEKGKKVHLSIRGEKTELDKRMIDELGDPLVHLVRNSIDHGLESPDVRLARRKPEAGTISLGASQRGNNVFISIHDDGGGIDPTRIKERLAARELLTPAAIADLSDEQTLEYIWHPGFSTAQEVSDISGRGVGMDAVRTRITELSGTIDVDSVPGQGTAFTIRLPLTLAIIGSLLARVRNVIFSMPIEDVREIVNVPSADVVTVRNRQTIDVRGEFIPLIDITDVFDWHQILDASAASPTTQSRATSDAIDAVILRAGERAMALRVDELLGSQDIVIKSLSQNFVQIKGLSGASILGDGTVSLMLDVHTVMNLALNPKEKVPELDPTG